MSMSDEKNMVLKAIQFVNGSTVAELSTYLPDIPRLKLHNIIIELQNDHLVKEGVPRNCDISRIQLITWWTV